MKILRAISPVVATALLVLIAVAVSVLLYTWVSGTVSMQPTGSQAMQARLVIDDVSFNKSSNKLTIYIRNVGSIPANLSAIYIVNATSGEALQSNTTAYVYNGTTFIYKPLSKVMVTPGGVVELQVNLSNKVTLKPGDVILVKVVPRNGVTATYVKTIRK